MKTITTEGMQLLVRDDKDLWGYSQTGVYEPEETNLIKQLVKPNWHCIDIGANIGYFTIIMAKLCDYVYAFEPNDQNYNLLRGNAIANLVDQKIISFRMAIGERKDIVTLFLCDLNPGMHRIFPDKVTRGMTEKVRLETIDSLLEHHYIDFIKMDIEGSEYGALKGMRKLLERCHPIIMMEWHTPTMQEYGANPVEVYNFLKDLGYSISLIPDKEEIDINTLIIKTTNISGGQNVLCQ